jgi:hypothetical protein
LRDAYETTEPGFDGHVSVPTLWNDRRFLLGERLTDATTPGSLTTTGDRYTGSSPRPTACR